MSNVELGSMSLQPNIEAWAFCVITVFIIVVALTLFIFVFERFKNKRLQGADEQ